MLFLGIIEDLCKKQIESLSGHMMLKNKAFAAITSGARFPGFRLTFPSIGALSVAILIGIFLVGCAGPASAPPEISGHLLVVGSTALQPLASAAADLFQREHPQAKIEVNGGGSIYLDFSLGVLALKQIGCRAGKWLQRCRAYNQKVPAYLRWRARWPCTSDKKNSYQDSHG